MVKSSSLEVRLPGLASTLKFTNYKTLRGSPLIWNGGDGCTYLFGLSWGIIKGIFIKHLGEYLEFRLVLKKVSYYYHHDHNFYFYFYYYHYRPHFQECSATSWLLKFRALGISDMEFDFEPSTHWARRLISLGVSEFVNWASWSRWSLKFP